MENQWHLGRFKGIPVSLHWTVFLTLPWMYFILEDGLGTLIAFTAFCFVMVAHEFGHVAASRWRGTYVDDIMLSGIHGTTSHGIVTRGSEILIAWAGVAAQLVILILALIAQTLLMDVRSPWVWMIAGPLFWALVKWNLFLMVAALLPIGPFDGHMAWKAIPYLREKARRRRRNGNAGEKVVKLDPAKRKELQQRSEKLAAEILDELKNKKKLH